MARKPTVKPTPSELAILRILWTQGPSTVRQVHDALSKTREVQYTGTLKLLQIMANKNLVHRDEAQRAHVYKAASPEENVKRQVVGDLIQKVFAGSASELVMHALGGKRPSQEEIQEIRRFLDDQEASQSASKPKR